MAIAEHLFQAGTVGASRIVQARSGGLTFEERSTSLGATSHVCEHRLPPADKADS